MLIIRKTTEIQDWLGFHIAKNKSIGFVPTMGALHSGHISLINQSKSNNDITVCSIFVNPTQFNDPKDLEKYPRTLESDSRFLEEAHCDVLFYPDVAEIYPKDLKEIKVDLNGLDLVMEGAHRPGHFNGVVRVVHRLLDIIKPHRIYMGQKDFQQFTIIAKMIEQLDLHTSLVVCPILREKNGLAMSSRNVRLSDQGRAMAGLIYKTISEVILLKKIMSPKQACSKVLEQLNSPPIQAEYVDIADIHTLQSSNVWGPERSSVLCVAVWLEGVRLIDNIIL